MVIVCINGMVKMADIIRLRVNKMCLPESLEILTVLVKTTTKII